MFALSACGATRSSAEATKIVEPPRHLGLVTPPAHNSTAPVDDAITRGELPWWHGLPPGVYRFEKEVVVVALGESKDYHHIAEGFMQAKVMARLGARRASEAIRNASPMPEPALEDLFITPEKRILALYYVRVPKDAELPPKLQPLERPASLRSAGRHRVGRHVFEGDRHLFLECDVEGPIANPDWGRTRAAARG
jgi:hypothetical protein